MKRQIGPFLAGTAISLLMASAPAASVAFAAPTLPLKNTVERAPDSLILAQAKDEDDEEGKKKKKKEKGEDGEPADLVLVGTAAPRDLDLVQAHKALLAASRLARPGAPIVWMARAPRGPGHPELLRWFESGSLPRHLAALREQFHPYGLTAFSLRRLASDHAIHVVSEVDREVLRPMGFLAFAEPQAALDHALAEARAGGREVVRVAVVPRG